MNAIERDQQKRQGKKSVYLGWTSYEVTVSAEAYVQIVELTQAMSVCHVCEHYYSKENPNVAGNMCLDCFLQMRPSLTFQGPLDPDLTEPPYRSSFAPYACCVRYLFLNTEGHAYITSAGPGEREEAREDKEVTLKYWQFPQPEQAEKNGKLVSLRPGSWLIYGDVHSNVVMLRYWDTSLNIDVLFLAKRGGQCIQINKRREMHRRLLADARAELEAMRTADGEYCINGQCQSRIYESDVYELIARRIDEQQRTGSQQPPAPGQ